MKVFEKNLKENSYEEDKEENTEIINQNRTDVLHFLPILTTEKILSALTEEWQTANDLIFKLNIEDLMDIRFLALKLKTLERQNKIKRDIFFGKRVWKLNPTQSKK